MGPPEDKGLAAPAAAGHQVKLEGSTIKLGVDIHSLFYVVAAQYDHAALKPPRRFAPEEFVPWVETSLRTGLQVHVVYEACGFGFGLYRQPVAAGAHGVVIAPRKLDEARKGVKTDALDATTPASDSRGIWKANTRSWQRSACRARRRNARGNACASMKTRALLQRLEAQGRCLRVSHNLPAPAHWWKEQTFTRLNKVLSAWIVPELKRYRPALLALHAQILTLTAELEAAAPQKPPRGRRKPGRCGLY